MCTAGHHGDEKLRGRHLAVARRVSSSCGRGTRADSMEELAEDVRGFLVQHPELQPVPGNKVRFTLTGHELPCRLLDLQKFIAGKKYKNTIKVSLDGSKYEPHIVPSTKNTGQMFCKLTLRHITKRLEDVERHVNGKRYQLALQKYEECQKQGVEYVPACLQKKNKPRKVDNEQKGGKKEQPWEPDNSSAEDSDSGDSMSDLYPEHMFKKTTDENGAVESNNDEEMEVEGSVNNGHGKRPQKQSGPSRKKLKSHHQKRKNVKKSARK